MSQQRSVRTDDLNAVSQQSSCFQDKQPRSSGCLLHKGFFSECGYECKTVALHDTVPNKPNYCNWPEGVPLWLIGGVPAQWNQFHVPLASCKPRLDLCSDGEVFLTYGKILLLAVSAFLTGDKLKPKRVIYWTNTSVQSVIKMLGSATATGTGRKARSVE